MEKELTKTKWGIDPMHSQIGFKVKHLMFTNVRGSFKEFEASIYTSEEDFMSAEIDFWINPASVNTGDKKRDAHLKSADFFDVENFKEINFTANSYEKVDNDGSYELYGNLTMKGIKKQIKLQVEFGGIIKDPWGNAKAVFNINGKINRKDWGLNWNAALETGGVLVSENVWISCEVQLTSPKTNFKMLNAFADKDENPELPGSEWDYNFSEQNGITKVSITIFNESFDRMEKLLEGFQQGFTMTLNSLEKLLAILSKRQ